jgi:hypothetical protein
MYAHRVHKCRLQRRGVNDPGVQDAENVRLSREEVCPNHLLKRRGRVLDHVRHRELHRPHTNSLKAAVGVVSHRVVRRRRAVDASTGLEVPRVLDTEDESLDGEQHLNKRRLAAVPLLAAGALPRAEQRQADLAAVVQVR